MSLKNQEVSMPETAPKSSIWQKIRSTYVALTDKNMPAKDAYVDYHLVRRKYILSQACAHFELDKHEPAPLLGKQLLDIGCGTNRIAEEIAFRGADCTAVDINDDAIHLAQRSAQAKGSPVEFLLSSAEELVREGRTYDVILCLDVLEYAEDMKRLVWAIDKLLQDNGIVIFSSINRTPKAWFFSIMMAENILKWVPKGTHSFKSFVKPKELETAFGKHRFKLHHITGVYFDASSRQWIRTPDTQTRYMGVFKR